MSAAVRAAHGTPAVHFRLERTALCLECDAVFEINGACPACASEQITSLARLINRPEASTLDAALADEAERSAQEVRA